MTTPMSTSLIPPEAGAGEIARNEMQSRLAGLGNLGGKKMDPAQKEKKLRESCEGFESIFIQKMWEEMRKTLPKSTLLHGKEEQFWQGMYDQELAKKMTSAGGIGLADMMYAQLSRGLVSASRSTATDASGMGQPAFTPEAAPMLTPSNTAENEREGSGAGAAGNNRASGSAASIYGGLAPTQDAGFVANGSAAAHTHTGDQAAADGQDPDEAARHAQQAMQASAQPERHKVVRTSNVPNMNSGLNLARMAQFEAGSKLGSNTVRPSMQQMMGLAQPQNRTQTPGQNSEQPVGGAGFDAASAPAAMPNMEIPPLMGNTLDAQMAMQAAMQPPQGQVQGMAQGMVPVQGQAQGMAPVQGQVQVQAQAQAGMPAQSQPQKPQTKVRFTTNVPPAGRSGKQGGLIRMLNTDGSGPNSNAGAGLAAYHAQQAQQVQAGGMQSAQAAQVAAGAQPMAQVSTLPMGPAGQPASPPASQVANQAAATGTPMPAQGGTPATAPGMVSPVPLTGGQISVRQGGKNADNHGATASGIPPLTATDVYGRQ